MRLTRCRCDNQESKSPDSTQVKKHTILPNLTYSSGKASKTQTTTSTMTLSISALFYVGSQGSLSQLPSVTRYKGKRSVTIG